MKENEYMPQVGGPSGGEWNKRNEVDMDASGDMQFYFSPFDRRLHLFGAEVGWVKVDFDHDDTVDLEINISDSDNDGFFDLWQYDLSGKGNEIDSMF